MIIGIFAKPGSGKTICLTILKRKSTQNYVWSTSAIKGASKLDFEELAENSQPFSSLILVDEISVHADNRDFKKTKKGFTDWIANHRHFGHVLVWCSQHFDGVDKKVRVNTSALYQCSMCGLFAMGNSDSRPLLGRYANMHPRLALVISKIPFIRPRVRLKRYVPAVGYRRDYKGANFGQLGDGHDALADGLSGLVQRFFQPRFWVVKHTVLQEDLNAYDTHDDQIGYWNRPQSDPRIKYE